MEINVIGEAALGILIMIALDIVAGITSAASRGELDSAKLRMGLLHKVGLILAFALAVALEWEERALAIGIDVPLVVPVATYVAIMEACSVYENIKRINPEFRFGKFEDLFKFTNEEEDVHAISDEEQR